MTRSRLELEQPGTLLPYLLAGLFSAGALACTVLGELPILLTPVDPEMAVAMTLTARAPTAILASEVVAETQTPTGEPTPIASKEPLAAASTNQPDPDCPATGITVGEWTRVALQPPVANRVRSAPSLQTGGIIGRAEPGTVLKVLEGPECADQMLWWRVRLEDGSGLEGWTGEGPSSGWLDPSTAESP